MPVSNPRTDSGDPFVGMPERQYKQMDYVPTHEFTQKQVNAFERYGYQRQTFSSDRDWQAPLKQARTTMTSSSSSTSSRTQPPPPPPMPPFPVSSWAPAGESSSNSAEKGKQSYANYPLEQNPAKMNENSTHEYPKKQLNAFQHYGYKNTWQPPPPPPPPPPPGWSSSASYSWWDQDGVTPLQKPTQPTVSASTWSQQSRPPPPPPPPPPAPPLLSKPAGLTPTRISSMPKPQSAYGQPLPSPYPHQNSPNFEETPNESSYGQSQYSDGDGEVDNLQRMSTPATKANIDPSTVDYLKELCLKTIEIGVCSEIARVVNTLKKHFYFSKQIFNELDQIVNDCNQVEEQIAAAKIKAKTAQYRLITALNKGLLAE